MSNQDHDNDSHLLWQAAITSILLEAVAVGLFLACLFVWLGILSGRI